MEEKNSVEVKNEKNRNIVPIVLIVILLLGIGCFLAYKYILGAKNTNVYYSFFNSLEKGVNNFSKEVNKKGTYAYDISFQVDGKDEEVKKIGNVLNKLKIRMDMNSNIDKKVLDMLYDITYDNNSILNAGIFIDNNDAFVSLEDLYDKNIKVNLGNGIWDSLNIEESQELVSEFIKILKRNLKSSYITITNDNLNGVNVSKQVLNLNSKNILEYEKNILTDIANNNKIIDYIYNRTIKTFKDTEYKEFGSLMVSKDLIKDSIKEAKENLKESNTNILVETYINKNKKLEGLNITVDDSKISLEKKEDNKFAIKVNAQKVTAEIGTVLMTDNVVDFDIDFMGMVVKYKVEFSKNNVIGLNYKVKFEGIEAEANIKNNTTNGSGEIMLSENGNKYKIMFNFEETKKPIEKDLSNYINVENMKEEDTLNIMKKLEENKNLATFVQDIQSAFQTPLIETKTSVSF